MTPEEKARRERLADSCRVITGGTMPDHLGDGGRREAAAHSSRVGKLMGAAHRGNKDSEIELARLLYAPELTK
jgi:hypothetical protein